MTKTETRPWDIIDSLTDDSRITAYLDAVFEEGDPQLIAAALGDIARARGMTTISRQTGLGRQSLYKTLSSTGHPELNTIIKVLASLGLRLTVAPKLTTPI